MATDETIKTKNYQITYKELKHDDGEGTPPIEEIIRLPIRN